jgi:anaerobic selenocysteine-containing dehydrogenase
MAVDTAFPEVACEFTPAMVAPRGEVRSYWWILAQLGKRMGMDFLPGVDPDTATDQEVIAHIAQRGRASVNAKGEFAYVVAEDRVFGWVRERARAVGGWRLAPPQLVAQLESFPPTPDLVMISRRQLDQHNSRKVESRRDLAAIYVHPDDARERGLADGDTARLRSAHGEIVAEVKYDLTLVRGALNVPHGWQGGCNVNNLTSMTEHDPITGMPVMSNLPVYLAKASAATPAGDELVDA